MGVSYKKEVSKKACVVIPAFNESVSIGGVLKSLKQAGFKNVVVVDDGSVDNTYDVALKNSIVLRHDINLGQGAALRTGMEFALREGFEFIVHFDADGQHVADEVWKLLKPVYDGEVDIALGSRFLKDSSGIPKFRRFALRVSVIILRLFYGLKVTDAHNGLRAMNRKAASLMRFSQNGMAHASEVLEFISAYNLRWREVPVTIKYTRYSIGKGVSSVKTWVKILLKMIWKKFL